MSAEWARMGLRAPVNVTWEVTLRCNLGCVHCLSDAGRAQGEELTTEECRGLVAQLKAMGVFQVNIGGGEPFLRDDFLDLLGLCHEFGIVTCVSTNGTVLDTGIARRLARLEMLYLQVSLDGATEAVNDPIRGDGTYRRILAGMDLLATHGVRFSVNAVLTRTNYPQLESLRGLAGAYGAELRVSRFRPSGRGRASKATLGPDPDQLEAFADWLERNDKVKTGDSFFCLTSEKRRRKGLDMCGAAKMTCCISPGGDVYPCAFLQEPPFRVGSIRETDLGTLWRESAVLREFRTLEVRTCERCYRFESCRGGCPAMAYHTWEDIRMPDPECLVHITGNRLFPPSMDPAQTRIAG